MLPNLSQAAHAVLAQAQVEARRLNQEYVGVEHLLLALLETPHTEAVRALRGSGVDLDALRTYVAEFLPFSEKPPNVTGDLPLTPAAQTLVSAAFVRSRSLRQATMTTRVLLLSMIEENVRLLLEGLRVTETDVAQLSARLAAKPDHPET